MKKTSLAILLSMLAFLCFAVTAFAAPISTSTLPDPTTAPIAALTEVQTLAHVAGWPLTILVGVFLLVELLAKIPSLAKLGNGRISIALGGGVAILATVINAFGSSGSWAPAIVAGAGAVLAYWHPAGVAPDAPNSSSKSPPVKPLIPVAILAGAIVLASVPSCATLKAMTGDWAACEKTDLGQTVKNAEGNLVPLSIAVATAIEGDGSALISQLISLVGQVGLDAVDCAKTAWAETHPSVVTVAGSAASASAQAPLVGAAKNYKDADDWINAQRKAMSMRKGVK